MSEPAPAAAPSPAPGHPSQIAIELPANLEAIYSNLALIVHAPSEVVIDFARVMPNTPKARIHARILMTPLHAKLLLRALADNLSRYEAQFGEIQIPTGLAEKLFRQTRPE